MLLKKISAFKSQTQGPVLTYSQYFSVDLNHFCFLFEFQRTAFRLMKNVLFSLNEIQTTLDNIFPYRN